MTDETTNAGAGGNGADQAQPQAQQPAPSLAIVSHFTRDLSFENVAAIQGISSTARPEINVTVNLEGGPTGDNRFTVAMKINAKAEAEGQTRFVVELDYIGIFDIQNVPQEHIHPFLFIECPRQLLPFARRVVADVTRDGGYPPLMLDNVDFAALYRQQLAELQKKQAAEGQTPPTADA